MCSSDLDGMKKIALDIHRKASTLESRVASLGFNQLNENYFDTLLIHTGNHTKAIRTEALDAGINFRYVDDNHISISLNETVSEQDLSDILQVFSKAAGKQPVNQPGRNALPAGLLRTSEYLTHPVFHTNRSETQMLRYIASLEKKDLSLNHSMIALGS